MRKVLFFVSLSIMLMVQACSSSDEPTTVEGNEIPSEISHMVVKFNGKVYETDVISIGDSVSYSNEEYANVYLSEISKIPEVASIVSKDETGTTYVEFFHSEKELLESNRFSKMETSTDSLPLPTRAKTIDLPVSGTTLGQAILHDDKGYRDTKLIAYCSNFAATAVARLKDLGFNDKTSSIEVYNKMEASQLYTISSKYDYNGSLATTWKEHYGRGLRPVLVSHWDSDFKGKVLYCIAPPTGTTTAHADYDLKKIGWNDKISSVGWYLVHDFSVFNKQGDKDPEIPAHGSCDK